MARDQIVRTRRLRSLGVASLSVAALAVLPASAMAAMETLGPPVLTSSATFVSCASPGCPFRTVAMTTATDSETLVTVPVGGTITGWRVRGSVGSPATISLRIIRPDGPGQFKGAGTSNAATVLDGSAENATSLPVKAGDLIGVDLDASGGGGAGVAYQAGAGTHSIWETPGLADGDTGIPTTSGNDGLLMLNATLVFGGDTKTTLSVAAKGAAIRAQGSVKPFAPGAQLSLTLSRKQNGKFKKIDSAHPALNTTGKYSSEFPRPKAGTCKLKARFAGDSDFAASSATKQFAC